MQHTPWWRDAVIYQVYPRSFADSNGDGIGDLPGITSHLPALADLGVDGVWISPFFTSPQADAGYDVADYCDVDPMFGTLDDADELIARAHELGLKIIVDIVPNHTSSAHPWFEAALRAEEGSLERQRYFFRPGRGENGDLPPNNWQSTFGGSAWTRTQNADGSPGEWYLHMFASSQPDLDWRNADVVAEFQRIFRFWADRGVDGFRIDVAHGMIKEIGLPDYTPPSEHSGLSSIDTAPPMWAQPEVHEIIRGWRTLLDEYPGDRLLCAEAWVSPLSTLAEWTAPGEMQHAFNFVFLGTGWDADRLRQVIDESIVEFSAGGGVPTWVLSNHDLVRHTTRLALDGPFVMGAGVGPGSANRRHDAAEGARRARSATLLMLSLPGSSYLYQGEELGLPEVIDMPDDARRDPTWEMSGHTVYGRDGCRVPLPWRRDEPNAGFSAHAPWLPFPSGWDSYARDAQEADPDSFLTFYRSALRLRRDLALGDQAITWQPSDRDVLDLVAGDTRIIVNMTDSLIDLPGDYELLLPSESGAIETTGAVSALRPSCAVWMTPRPL